MIELADQRSFLLSIGNVHDTRKLDTHCAATAIDITLERTELGKISASITQQTGPHDMAKPAV